MTDSPSGHDTSGAGYGPLPAVGSQNRPVLQWFEAHPEGGTDYEVAEALGRPAARIRFARSDLKDKNFYQFTIVGQRPSPDGGMCSVRALVPGGPIPPAPLDEETEAILSKLTKAQRKTVEKHLEAMDEFDDQSLAAFTAIVRHVDKEIAHATQQLHRTSRKARKEGAKAREFDARWSERQIKFSQALRAAKMDFMSVAMDAEGLVPLPDYIVEEVAEIADAFTSTVKDLLSTVRPDGPIQSQDDIIDIDDDDAWDEDATIGTMPELEVADAEIVEG